MANPTLGAATQYYGQPVNIGTFINVTATTTGTLIKAGEGALYGLTINSPTAGGVITLYDGLTTGGVKIATITVPTSPQLVSLYYDIYFTTGLYIVVATQAEDITISYK